MIAVCLSLAVGPALAQAPPRRHGYVAEWMTANNERLSALNASNVEQYLFRDGGFDTFAKSVERFPRNARSARSVIIRSCFVCGGGPPQGVNGYHTVMSVQLVSRFAERYAAGQITRYDILITLGLVTP